MMTIVSLFGGNEVCYQANDPASDAPKNPPYEGDCTPAPKQCPHKGGFLPHDWCADSVGNELCPEGMSASDSSNWGKCCDAYVLGVNFDAVTGLGSPGSTTLYEMKVANYTKALTFKISFVSDDIWDDLVTSVDKEEPRARQCGYRFVLVIADQKLVDKARAYYVSPPHSVEIQKNNDCEAYRDSFPSCSGSSARMTRPNTVGGTRLDSLLIYKVRPGVTIPRTVEDFGNSISAGDLLPPDPIVAEHDVNLVLPDFRWPSGAAVATYSSNGIEIDLRLGPNGLFGQIRDARSLDILKQIARAAGWLIVEPATLRFVG